jgi:hypothetical protein
VHLPEEDRDERGELLPPMRPRRRRLNQDYQAMVAAYNAQKQFREASKGTVKMACVLCHKTRVTRAFLPCDHAAVCDACMEKNDIGPMRPNGTGKAPGRGKVGSGHIMWDMCPVCLGNILAIVPVGTTQDAGIRKRVEAMLVSVSGAASGASGVQGGDAVPQRFKTLFARSGRLLTDWSDARKAGGAPGTEGPPTKSDLLAAGWDDLSAASSSESETETETDGGGGGRR